VPADATDLFAAAARMREAARAAIATGIEDPAMGRPPDEAA